MKYFILIIIIQLLTSFVYAQEAVNNTIVYSYDNAGNRIKREILLEAGSKIAHVKEDTSKTKNSNPEKLKITDKLGEFDISIYPNPTEGKLAVNVSNMPEDTQNRNSIKVFDLFGKELYNNNVTSSISEIDISLQPVGTYIMKINIADKTAVWKIIKK